MELTSLSLVVIYHRKDLVLNLVGKGGYIEELRVEVYLES